MIQYKLLFLFLVVISTLAISQTYSEKADCTEEWYGVKYCIEKHTAEQEIMWRKCGFLKKLHLPARNDFVPHNFDLVERDLSDTQHPRLIRVSFISQSSDRIVSLL